MHKAQTNRFSIFVMNLKQRMDNLMIGSSRHLTSASNTTRSPKTKTYFITNALDSVFPSEFVYSTNPKFIHVQHCRAIFKDYLVGDIELHASFVQRNAYADSFICFTNTQLTKYKKYEYMSTKPTFKLWFTDMNNKPVNVSNFKLEMMLEY